MTAKKKTEKKEPKAKKELKITASADNKPIPPCPPTNPLMGEYTPEYLGWMKKYKPDVFKKKYKEKVTKFKYKVIEPK